VPIAATETDQLWVDPSGADLGITFGINDIKIIQNGSLTMTAFTGIVFNPGTAFSLTGGVLDIAATGDAINGNRTAFEIGTLTIADVGSGAGDITLFSGDFLDGNFVQQNLTTPQTLAVAAPEPETLMLLGAAVGGLAAGAWARRRRV
jgi:hypothetical protein